MAAVLFVISRCFILISAVSLLIECHSTLEHELQDAKRDGKVLVIADIIKNGNSRVKRDQDHKEKLGIFCHPGLSKRNLWRLWTSYTLRLRIDSDEYSLYSGPNATEVYRQFQNTAKSWFQFMPWRTDSVSMRVFNETCVGVDTKDGYSVQLYHKVVDPWLIGYLISGLILFFSARRLSRNLMFYYGTGIGFGLIASLLIFVFILSRFMPKKFGAYAVLVGGWSLTLWLIQYIWEHIQQILEEYIIYVAAYFLSAGIISFAILYYKGPVTNPRMINLIKWALQALSLALIYNGTQIQEISITLIVLMLAVHAIPSPSYSLRGTTFWWRWFPRFVPRTKLLTEEEYLQQGREETKKALDDLRKFCRSPDCNSWKTMSRLNSPHRFASWVDGGSHFSDDEMQAYNSDPTSLNFTDDSDESELSFRLTSP